MVNFTIQTTMQQEKKYNKIVSLLNQFLLSALFVALIYIPAEVIDKSNGTGNIFPASVFYIIPAAFFFLILFFVLASYYNVIWTLINILLTIYLFRIELSYINSKTDLYGLHSVLFFSLFLVINKTLIELILGIFNPKRKPNNKLDLLIYKALIAISRQKL